MIMSNIMPMMATTSATSSSVNARVVVAKRVDGRAGNEPFEFNI